MKKKVLIVQLSTFLFLAANSSYAQCAMCRVAVENNINSGESSIGSGLNTGILYLLSIPYLAIGLIGYFWYKNSKKNYENHLIKRDIIRKVSSL